jgi:pilus assembly protein CpaB
MKDPFCAMNQTRRLVILAVALGAALCAALVASQFVRPAQVVQPVAPILDQIEVLVAKREIRMGDRVSTQDLKWQAWPKEAATQGYITKSAKPKAMADYDKAIARTGVLQGEPISEGKFVRCSEDPNKKVQCEGGAMAAILPSGMRAIAVKINEETSAGRFILPNDMVDIILTRRMRSRGTGGEDFVSDTLFQNVRVLAIGQNLETKDGKKTVDGGTTTLELTPAQSEQLVLAKSMGEISLSLRSLADLRSDAGGPIGKEKLGAQRGGGIKLLRYGVGSRAYGVN